MYKKCTKKYDFSQIFLSESFVFCEPKSKWAIWLEKTSDLLIHSFIMSDLSESLTVTHLSWVTWVICSWSLFWHEQPEWFAHRRSFVLSWAIWANCSQLLIWFERSQRMSKWANEQIPYPGLSIQIFQMLLLQFKGSIKVIILSNTNLVLNKDK